jgi:hypothetical protein
MKLEKERFGNGNSSSSTATVLGTKLEGTTYYNIAVSSLATPDTEACI